MKKFVSIFSIILLSFQVFAFEYFGDRFVEVYTDVPFGLSNNAINLNDIMKKDIVIDLEKIASGLPDDGFNLNINTEPEVGLNVNLLGIKAGIGIGETCYVNTTIGKGLFNLLGTGNTLYESVSITGDVTADSFTYINAYAALKLFGLDLKFEPALFLPTTSVVTKSAEFTFSNSKDGDIGLVLNANGSMYSNLNLSNYAFDYSGIGLDVSGEVGLPIFEFLYVRGKARIPIYPGSYSYETALSASMKKTISLKSYMNLNTTSSSSEDNGDKEFEYSLGDTKAVKYYINRPMKLSVNGELKPMGDFLTLNGGVGFGVLRPFAEDTTTSKVYPEYNLNLQLNFFKCVVLGVSTEYTDQIFKQSLITRLNLRVFEIDIGLSSQSATLAQSLQGAGFGCEIRTCFGF